MCDCKVFINYRNKKYQIYGLSYHDLPNDEDLKEMLVLATESLNRNAASRFSSCCYQQDLTEKYISDEEMENFQILKRDKKETSNEVYLKLTLPGDEKKMKLVYNEFFKLLYMSANGKSYIMF